MLFVNDLYEPGVPHWLVHAKAEVDGMGLADWVFPGFLFMVGMAIPYAINSRIKKGETSKKIFTHILLRTLSLLTIGFFVMNGEEYLNENLTGINHLWWLTAAYVCLFLIWNKYPAPSKYAKLFIGLKVIGILGLLFLAYIFKSGEALHPSWMHIGWWGILGLIGWGYFSASVTYLLARDNIVWTALVGIFFIVLNILSQLGKLDFLHSIQPIFGVILDGNVPSIVVSGLLLGNILRKYKKISSSKLIVSLTAIGISYLVIGFFLRHWFILSKIQGTPSWAMVCNGISIIVLTILYFIVDIKGKTNWTYMFKEAGKNSLTTYLAPDIIYFVTWGVGLPIYFYKQIGQPWLAITGSFLWAFIMIWMAIFLSKIKIQLKL
ncbi:DUF5009 domain-containing protein [Rhizosphaericola mali]|nr:DUF5009 domain-containing protein [Rhizosphaericola mali]